MTQSESSKSSKIGITRIGTSGFKSIVVDQSIDVRPLTILSGANSSGKSSMMQTLLLLKQTLDATYDPGPLLLFGPNVRFSSTEQMFSKVVGNQKTSKSISHIEVEIDNNSSIRSDFAKQKRGVDLIKTTHRKIDSKYVLEKNMTDEKLRAILPKSALAFADQIKKSLHDNTPVDWRVGRERCFLRASFNFDKDYSLVLPPSFISGLSTDSIESSIRGVIHVPGLRGNPERTYRTSAVGKEFPGTFENYVANIVSLWQSTDVAKLEELGSDLATLGLTWKVETKPVDDTQVELRVGRLKRGNRGGAKDTVNIADVGFGVSQTLPVLVALLTARKNQLVYIEQPEIHLHPRAQIALAQVVAKSANRGVRVVIETHSDLFILAIQTLIAEGSIPPRDVVLHWFSRDDDGSTHVYSAEIDAQGSFGQWPEDFSEVTLELKQQFLDAVEQHT